MDAKNMSLWGGKIDEPAREEGNKNFLKTRETWNRNIKTLKKNTIKWNKTAREQKKKLSL